MSDTCTTVRISLGAYLLGALDPAERAVTEAHLAGCPACRDELAALSGLPGLLGRLSLADVADPGELGDLADRGDPAGHRGQPDRGDPPDHRGWAQFGGPLDGGEWPRTTAFPRAMDAEGPASLGRSGPGSSVALARALAEIRHRRQATRRRTLAAAAALVLVVAGASTGVTVAVTGSDGRPPGRMITATDAVTRVGASVWVANDPAGSAFTVRLWNVPPGSHCVLVALATDGRRETAASWAANYHGYVDVRGTSGIAVGQLARLLVVDDHGQELVELPARPA